MLTSAPARVRCRQIQIDDLDAVANLLTEGFPDRSRKYWTTGLDRLRRRQTPTDFPRFGYVLEAEGALVGVLLVIFIGGGQDGAPPRFNLSSWYVRPDFRAHATLMVSLALKRKEAVFLNTSPLAATLPILAAMGFRPLTSGQFLSVPLLSRRGHGAQILRIEADAPLGDYPDPVEFELLRAHAAEGCLSLACRDERGWAPLVLLRRSIAYSPVGVLQLAYCRDTADLPRFAGALGRFMLRTGHGLVLSDGDGATPGLVGKFFKGKSPKFYKGPTPPRINDLAFTEAVVFGP